VASVRAGKLTNAEVAAILAMRGLRTWRGAVPTTDYVVRLAQKFPRRGSLG
jgi:hypothetical protein